MIRPSQAFCQSSKDVTWRMVHVLWSDRDPWHRLPARRRAVGSGFVFWLVTFPWIAAIIEPQDLASWVRSRVCLSTAYHMTIPRL